MKDFTKESLEMSRPNEDAETCINFCLKQLYADRTKQTTDNVVALLTYEELIGALLLALDLVEAQKEDAGNPER